MAQARISHENRTTFSTKDPLQFFVYIVVLEPGLWKVGITKDRKKRLQELKVQFKQARYWAVTVHRLPRLLARELERDIKEKFPHPRRNEYKHLLGHTEYITKEVQETLLTDARFTHIK